MGRCEPGSVGRCGLKSWPFIYIVTGRKVIQTKTVDGHLSLVRNYLPVLYVVILNSKTASVSSRRFPFFTHVFFYEVCFMYALLELLECVVVHSRAAQ